MIPRSLMNIGYVCVSDHARTKMAGCTDGQKAVWSDDIMGDLSNVVGM